MNGSTCLFIKFLISPDGDNRVLIPQAGKSDFFTLLKKEVRYFPLRIIGLRNSGDDVTAGFPAVPVCLNVIFFPSFAFVYNPA